MMKVISPLKNNVAACAAALLIQSIATAQTVQSAPSPTPQVSPSIAAPGGANSTRTANKATPASEGAPPPNRLNQQVNAPVPVVMPSASAKNEGPTVTYPTPNAIVEQTVRKIEDLQLTPEQYDRLKSVFLERNQQRAMPYLNPPKPVTRTLLINLDPGVTPPTLRLSRGQQTSLVFSDVSGQPWFIEKVSMNRQLFSDGRQSGAGQTTGTGQNTEAPTNVLSIEALNPAAYGNVTITLKGQSTPLIFVLTTGQTEVDMRVDAKVPGQNPDSEATIRLQAAPSLDNVLPYFLDGVPPSGAKRMRVTGLQGAEAWVYGNNLYVKARADAQYPAYFSAARSTNGISVYRYMGVPKAATFTAGGQALTAFFE